MTVSFLRISAKRTYPYDPGVMFEAPTVPCVKVGYDGCVTPSPTLSRPPKTTPPSTMPPDTSTGTPSPPPELPSTGVDTVELVGWGLLILGIGILTRVVMWVRSRTDQRQGEFDPDPKHDAK